MLGRGVGLEASVMDAVFQENLLSSRALVEERYRRCFGNGYWNEEIYDLGLYALQGGKALRPALLIASFQELTQSPGRPDEHVVDLALGLEMIHAYSLIHDDLPSMDNDDFRRGRPTIHRLVSEGKALLVGDALLTGAFEAIARSTDLLPKEKCVALRELSRAAGSGGMIAGQWLDLSYIHTARFDDERERIHRLKTGALFGAALALAVLASHRYRALDRPTLEKNIEAARSWGIELGLFFQLSDDLLDRDFGNRGEAAIRQQAQELQGRLSRHAREWGGGEWIQKLLQFFLTRKQ